MSIARALVRALRKTGGTERAIQLANRVEINFVEPLLGWLAMFAHIEKVLSIFDSGQVQEACATLSTVLSRLVGYDERASDFHRAIFETDLTSTGDGLAIESHVDLVYY